MKWPPRAWSTSCKETTYLNIAPQHLHTPCPNMDGSGGKMCLRPSTTMSRTLSYDRLKAIQDVLFLHDIVKNLILVGYIADKNVSLEFVYKGCYIKNRNGDRLIVVVSRDAMNGLYMLKSKTIMANSSKVAHTSWLALWRQISVHWSWDLSATSSMPKGIFPTQSPTKTSSILEHVHYDMCSPFRIKYLGGVLYYIILWMISVGEPGSTSSKRKKDSLTYFQKFKAEVEMATKQWERALRMKF